MIQPVAESKGCWQITVDTIHESWLLVHAAFFHVIDWLSPRLSQFFETISLYVQNFFQLRQIVALEKENLELRAKAERYDAVAAENDALKQARAAQDVVAAQLGADLDIEKTRVALYHAGQQAGEITQARLVDLLTSLQVPVDDRTDLVSLLALHEQELGEEIKRRGELVYTVAERLSLIATMLASDYPDARQSIEDCQRILAGYFQKEDDGTASHSSTAETDCSV